jgi:TRAP-type C4-dicarboxylate transport system permease small subunit
MYANRVIKKWIQFFKIGMKILYAPLIVIMRLMCMDVDEQSGEDLKFKIKK